MRSRRNLTACLFAFTAMLTQALEVSPNSPCAKRCIDDPENGDVSNRSDSLTFHPDLSCFDWNYSGDNSTDGGRKFADCGSCLQGSGYEDGDSGERDSGWFLFNNRATVDYCIFGRFAEENNPNVSSTYPYEECNSDCNAIYQSSDYRIKSDPASYDYCDTNGNFTADADKCIACLYNATSLTILGNILTTVQQMCISKPGKVVGFDANVYIASRIQLSTATSSTSLPTASPTNSGDANSDDNGLGKGTIAGIVLGALIGIALLLAGILYILRRLRNRRKIIQMPNAELGTTPAQNYAYGAVPQQGKEGYAHNAPPVAGGVPGPMYETEGQQSPAELGGGQGVVPELGPSSPTGRR